MADTLVSANIPEGIYSIRPSLNTNYGLSFENNANTQNAQVYIKLYGDGSKNSMKFLICKARANGSTAAGFSTVHCIFPLVGFFNTTAKTMALTVKIKDKKNVACPDDKTPVVQDYYYYNQTGAYSTNGPFALQGWKFFKGSSTKPKAASNEYIIATCRTIKKVTTNATTKKSTTTYVQGALTNTGANKAATIGSC